MIVDRECSSRSTAELPEFEGTFAEADVDTKGWHMASQIKSSAIGSACCCVRLHLPDGCLQAFLLQGNCTSLVNTTWRRAGQC